MFRKLVLLVFAAIVLFGAIFIILRRGIKQTTYIGPVIVTATPTTAPTIIPTATAIPTQTPSLILSNVPFTAQAPFAEWSDPRQQDACEEASSLMAVYWARNKVIASKEKAKAEILAISKYQEENYGEYRDTSSFDTVKRIINGYFGYKEAAVKGVGNAQDIISELLAGNIVITPMNGQSLKNPHFKQPGPERHMLVIKGYDFVTQEFITNDPGIREGEGYRYPKEVIFNAIRDFETGYHVPILTVEKRMIVVSRI